MLKAYAYEGFMAPVIARIFRNGRNQAVRIPVELSLDAETVTIERQGDALILRPLPSGGWDQFFADPSLVLPPDFEVGDDPPPQERSEH
jgi:antitoxin VapB